MALFHQHVPPSGASQTAQFCGYVGCNGNGSQHAPASAAGAAGGKPLRIGRRPTISRPSRRCSAPSSSTTRPATGSRASSLPEHFFEAVHARIYEAASTLIRAGKLAAPVTLKTYFEQDDTLNEIGGPAYLARLAAAATTIINAEEYGRTIYELAMRRRLIGIGTDIVNECLRYAGR